MTAREKQSLAGVQEARTEVARSLIEAGGIRTTERVRFPPGWAASVRGGCATGLWRWEVVGGRPRGYTRSVLAGASRPDTAPRLSPRPRGTSWIRFFTFPPYAHARRRRNRRPDRGGQALYVSSQAPCRHVARARAAVSAQGVPAPSESTRLTPHLAPTGLPRLTPHSKPPARSRSALFRAIYHLRCARIRPCGTWRIA